MSDKNLELYFESENNVKTYAKPTGADKNIYIEVRDQCGNVLYYNIITLESLRIYANIYDRMRMKFEEPVVPTPSLE